MIRLYINKYTPENKERRNELEYCLAQNIKNNLFDKIVFVEGRSYNDMFKAIKDDSSPFDINVISNSDIIFDQTIYKTRTIGAIECYALSRRDITVVDPLIANPVPLGSSNYAKYPNDSQDVWIFRGVPKGINGAFDMGTLGCDNRIAYEIAKAGYLISNPCTKINCFHLHLSNERTYSKENIVPPPYKYVNPC